MTRRLHRTLAFGCACLLVLAWLAGDLLSRRVWVPGELRYIPPGYTLLAATGNTARLWEALDEQFGPLLRNDPNKGPLFTLFKQLRSQLKSKKLEVKTVADVDRLGLDPSRGALIASYPSRAQLLVLTASNVERLLETLETFLGSEGKQTTGTHGTVLQIGKYFAANPEGRLLVLSTDREVLDSALDNVNGTQRYQAASDEIYEPIVRELRRPMLTGPAFFLAFNGAPNALLRRGVSVISFDARGVSIEGVGRLEPSSFRIIDSLLGAAPPFGAWSNQLPDSTAGALVLRDRSLSQYVSAVAQAQGLGSFMEQRYAGVLGELRSLPSLRQMSIAMTDFRDGLPDLSLLVWADPDALDAMVTRIQARIRARRDREIIRNARAVGEQPADEPGSRFSQYPSDGSPAPPVVRTAQDFANPSYERRIGDTTVRLLLPPVTDNDITYRPDIRAIKDDPDLRSDRYRLAVARIGDLYWFATDASIIRQRLERASGAGTLDTAELFRIARPLWRAGDRVEAFVNIDRILELAALNPEVKQGRGILKYMRELQLHPSAAMSLSSQQNPSRVRVHIRLDRRP
jgi:hypothetical protein